MSLPFFYSEFIDNTATTFVLNEDTSKHIVQVLRMKAGSLLQLTDGKGCLLTAEITDDHKKSCVVKKTAIDFIKAPSNEITIAISLIKNASRFEWFLEKTTEVGVTKVIPLLCDRTEKQYFRMDRMKGILISAMLQSKQTWLPVLQEPTTFKLVITSAAATSKYIAHCEDDQSKLSLASIKNDSSSIILIGPEGDFTDDEITLAKSNNYLPVSLGETRLRTETAGVVASVLLNI